ncbi:TPA: hypothetical protein ACGPBV_002004 [Streptococcus suis]
MRKCIFNLLVVVCIVLLMAISIGLLYRTDQLQNQVDNLQGQVNTYRTLIFNLYEENGG